MVTATARPGGRRRPDRSSHVFVLEGLAALAAKVAATSTVTQAVAGVGIAVAGVTGAGAAGALPTPVQDAVAGAVEVVSPFDLPDSSDAAETDDSGTDGPGDVPGADDSGTDSPEDTGGGGAGPGGGGG